MDRTPIVWYPTGATPSYRARQRAVIAAMRAANTVLALYLIAVVSGLGLGVVLVAAGVGR